MKINPILKKEMVGMSRTIKLPVSIFIIDSLVAMYTTYLIYYVSSNFYYSTSLEEYASYIIELGNVYRISIYAFYALGALAVALYASIAIAQEREKQTYEMLITTSYNPVRIITGKLGAANLVAFAILISILPIIITMFMFFPIKIIDIFNVVLLMIVIGVYLGSVVIFVTAKSKNSKSTVVISVLCVVALVAGSIILWRLGYFIKDNIVNYGYYNDRPGADYHKIRMKYVQYLNLFNPAISVYAFANKITGNYLEFESFIEDIDIVNNFIVKHWCSVSCACQMIVSGLFVFLASKRIEPLKKTRKYIKYLNKIQDNHELPD